MKDIDCIDLFLMILTLLFALGYTTAYFLGIAPDQNISQWFLTLVSVFIAKKVPPSISK